MEIIIAAPQSDSHVVAISLINDFLELIGVKTHYLGACCSVDRMAECLSQNKGVTHIVISAANGHAVADLQGLTELKAKYPVQVFLGGKVDLSSGDSAEACYKKIKGVDKYFGDIQALTHHFSCLCEQEANLCKSL